MSSEGNVVDQMASDLSDYASNPEYSVWLLAVKGDSGSGKTLFCRSLLSKIIDNENEIL